jgi:hypothetical protein
MRCRASTFGQLYGFIPSRCRVLHTGIQGMSTLMGNEAHLLFYFIKPVATSYIWSGMHSCKPCSLYLCLMIPRLTIVEHCSVWVVMIGKLMPILFNNCRQNRTDYKKGGHITDPRSLTVLELLCIPYIHAITSPAL